MEEQSLLYGAVTMGNAWQFGVLDTKQQQINQDIALYSIPNDLNQLMAILMGILQQEIVQQEIVQQGVL